MNTLTGSPAAKSTSLGKALASRPAPDDEVVAGPAERTWTPAGKGPVRLLLADDHPVVLKGLRAFLEKHEGLLVVGEACDGQEALRQARALTPDMVLMDIDMPRLNGLTVTEMLHNEAPHIKVLILSMHRNTEFVLRTLQSGASGYLLKEGPPEDVVHAIWQVHAGQTFFSPEIARVALNQFVRGGGEGPDPSLLTSREREVLIQIAKGLSNKETACRLKVGVRTVETHRERIMRKLSIHTVAGLTRFALAKGYISLSEEPLR
jgi:two-component system, NarL family, nitrate/nitrite response regulator NarL